MWKFLSVVFTGIILCSSTPRSATASHTDFLRDAACQYREAAVRFGNAVIRERGYGVYERRIGYDLLRTSSRMQVYSRHPNFRDRLRDCWWDLGDVHERIELVLFAHPGCPEAARLMQCYRELNCAFAELEQALASIGCYHRHYDSTRQIWYGSGPNRYTSGVRAPTFLEILLGAVVTNLDSGRDDHDWNRHHAVGTARRHSETSHHFEANRNSVVRRTSPVIVDRQRDDHALPQNQRGVSTKGHHSLPEKKGVKHDVVVDRSKQSDSHRHQDEQKEIRSIVEANQNAISGFKQRDSRSPAIAKPDVKATANRSAASPSTGSRSAVNRSIPPRAPSSPTRSAGKVEGDRQSSSPLSSSFRSSRGSQQPKVSKGLGTLSKGRPSIRSQVVPAKPSPSRPLASSGASSKSKGSGVTEKRAVERSIGGGSMGRLSRMMDQVSKPGGKEKD